MTPTRPAAAGFGQIVRSGSRAPFPSIAQTVCGIDMHKSLAVACVLGSPDDSNHFEIRSFGTFQNDIAQLGAWLATLQVELVAMESTSVYWMPTHAKLVELGFKVLVINASHFKILKGRKTDVEDAYHLATLARAGMLRGSRVMPREDNEVREMVRSRVKLVQTATSFKNRVLKLLEKSGFKLADVMSDVFGKTGTIILNGLLDRSAPGEIVAEIERRMGYRLKTPKQRLLDALSVPMTDDLHFSLENTIGTYADLQMRITEVEERLEARFEARGDTHKIDLLLTLPGVSKIAAMTLLAELGDLSSFKSAKDLSSWAGMCPGNNESAGKRGATTTRKGNSHLRRILCEVALSASKAECYFKTRYMGIKSQRGHKRAVVAIGHILLRVVYHMLTKNDPYKDREVDYEELVTQRNAPRWIRCLAKYKGLHVTKLPPKGR